MKTIKERQDVFFRELRLLWNIESLLVESMPMVIARATNEGLKNLLRFHFAETDQHRIAIEGICKQLGIDPEGEFDAGMKDIIQENEKAMNNAVEDIDAVIVEGARKIERYEISGYTSAAYSAGRLGYEGICKRLRLTLEEEQQADTKLGFVGMHVIDNKDMMVSQD